MLRSVKDLHDYKIHATDGEVGKVETFVFDDEFWTVRYLVADTGSWLEEKLVLISPVALEQPQWEDRTFPVNLTKKQIENSPDIDADKPVSRKHEMQLHQYYDWPLYWTGAGMSTMATPSMPPVGVEPPGMEDEEQDNENDHLRSTKEVLNYHIRAVDGEIGHVEDIIVGDESWVIRYFVVDTRNWLPGGRKVLISPEWIDHIDWAGARVHFDLTQKLVEDAPEFDPSTPINREYEERLYDFYGRPKYWKS